MNGTINNNNTLSVMDFFESRRATEHHSTHVSMVHPKGSFRLSRQDYDLFFKILEGMPLSEVSKLGIAEAQVDEDISVFMSNTGDDASAGQVHLDVMLDKQVNGIVLTRKRID